MSSTGARPKTKSVKKKVRYVPSRYMQAAENVSLGGKTPLKSGKEMSSNSSEDFPGTSSELSIFSASSQRMASTPAFKATMPLLPTLDESAVTNDQSQFSVPSVKERIVRNVPPRYMKAAENVSLREKSPLKSGKEMSSNSSEDLPGTSPELSTFSASSQGMASTPAFKATMLLLPTLDESAVTNDQSQFSVPAVKERIVPRSSDFVKKNGRKQRMADGKKDEDEEDSFDEDVANEEMDLLYSQYLQSLFLVSQAKLALEKRSSAAVETLHKLVQLVQQHLEKANSKKTLLAFITILIEAYEHSQKQHKMLKPVLETIPALEEKYKSLAEAINATKHKLDVKDIIIPESDEIQENLQKMTEFLTSFFKALPFKDVNSTADDLKKYVDFAEQITDELKRSVDLLIEAQELCISEASLALGSEKL